MQQNVTSEEKTAASGLAYTLHYSDSSRPLLINISGLDGTGLLFFKQIPALALSYRIVTYRQRDNPPFTYEDLADDVAAIVRNEGEQRATITAESFGGAVALTFALRFPSMVERLVIINSFARYRERIRIKLAARLARWLPFTLVWPVRKIASLIGLLGDDVPRESRRRFFEATRRIKGPAYAERLRMIADLDLEDRLSEIHALTLFIATEKDLLVRSIREARLMAARVADSEVRIIKGAGHACLLGDRVVLADIIAEWKAASAQVSS
jgi:pimeloyl-ACP methyl ester carboxylesterase